MLALGDNVSSVMFELNAYVFLFAVLSWFVGRFTNENKTELLGFSTVIVYSIWLRINLEKFRSDDY